MTQTTVTKLFAGQPTEVIACEIGTLSQLREEVAKHAVGSGWGLSVQVPRSLADKLGIYELHGGGLAHDGEPISEGSISEEGWTLTIEGEGEHPGSLAKGDEARAIKWAEKLIRRGDYDLAPGEITTVRYSLRRGDVQVDRHVDVYRSEEG
jgi:hypothetical protein